MANLCRALSQKGYTVDLACIAGPPDQPVALEHKARERHIEPILDLRLDKRPNVLSNRHDIRALARMIDDEEIQIIHVHTTHDHYIGSRAARRANNRPRIVRSNHRGEPLPGHVLTRLFFRGSTHGWVAYSQSCLEKDCRTFGIREDLGVAVEGAIDLDRFQPGVGEPTKRAEFGFTEEHVVVGVVARIQPHRRFDVLIEAFRRALSVEPRLRGLVLGRGTRQKRLLADPLQDLGIDDCVVHAGYRKEDYVSCLACMDALVFLVPGTDGSCRAARELMAMGKPVIASQRGVLPELVGHERCGLVIDDTAENLSAAMIRLARNPDLRRELGSAAAEKARTRFTLDRQAQIVGDLYMRIAGLPD